MPNFSRLGKVWGKWHRSSPGISYLPLGSRVGENGTDCHLPDWISYLPLGSQALLVVIHWVHNGCDLFEVPLRAAGISETRLTHQV